MFNNKEDDYLKATKDAQIYTSVGTKSNKKKLVIVNLLLLGFLLYFTVNYVQSNTSIFSTLTKQAVLGVSEIVDTSELSRGMNIDFLEENEKKYLQNDLSNSMKVLMNESTIKSKSSYTEAIARELDDKSGFRGKIAVVKQDESISSISKKY